MRPVVFLGTPAAAVTVLDAVVAAGHPVPLVVSRADARRGRGGALSPSPVKARALELGLAVTDDLEAIMSLDLPEDSVGVVVAYGRIIPLRILDRIRMVNVHFSLLPRWRGAAPVERAILAGDEETGVCIMQMEEGLDTGGVYARAVTRIGEHETASGLTSRLALMGADLMCSVLAGPLGDPDPQSGESTYARKITADDTVVDWSRDAATIDRQVRALTPHTTLDGRRLRILAAEPFEGQQPPGEMSADCVVGTGLGRLRLVTVQPEGKQAMDASDWSRGLKTGFPVILGRVP